jgi:hypothetical protein
MNSAWARTDLTTHQKIVLLALADRADEKGMCWPSIGWLVARTSMSERGVQKTIRTLEELGLLERQNWSGRSNRFVLNLPPHPVHPTEDDPRTVCTPAPHDVHPCPAPCAPNTSIIHQLSINKTSKPKREAQEPPPKTGPFQDAINAQSKQGRARLNRPKAWAIWQRISKVHGEEKLLAAYKRYLSTDKDAQRDNGDWQAGLQVWLNQKAEIWLEHQSSQPDKRSPQYLRRFLDFMYHDKTYSFPEDKLGMTEQEARAIVAAAVADGSLPRRSYEMDDAA